MSIDVTQDAEFTKIYRIHQVFRPGAPIDKNELFSGRQKQLRSVMSAVMQPGRHAVVYGERGVGKTSLAHVVSEQLEATDPNMLISGTINCDGTDGFGSIWHKVFREMTLVMQTKGIGFTGQRPDAMYTLDGLLNATVTPDDIRFSLSQIRQPIVIILDEFDRIRDKDVTTTLLADTIKTLSDHTMNVTLVLIGVADTVDDLIHEHASVERSIEQVPMPRMRREELEQIIQNGLVRVDMTMTDPARAWITNMSRGLPHYTHLLARDAAIYAVRQGRTEITAGDVIDGIELTADKDHSLTSAYTTAVASPQPNNKFPEVLLACALADEDELGWFKPSSVCEPLSRITGRDCNVPDFSRHISAFCGVGRGYILQSKGDARRRRYRFSNPLMQPFVILHGYKDGLLKYEGDAEE